MSTELKIRVTKEILKRSMMCGTSIRMPVVGKSCAISLSVIDIFPNAFVSSYHIYLNGDPNNEYPVTLPPKAINFISEFDAKRCFPASRLLMDELEFSIQIPDSEIEKINIDSVKQLLVNHPTLQLV